jgi:mono/diheme cytochrome c family protein
MKKFACVAFLVFAAAFVSTAAAAQAGQAGASASSPDAKRGETFYNKYGCWECHGYTASTGNAAVLVTSSLSAGGFTSYIRNPRTAGMPAYSAKVVPDSEVADIYAFVKTQKRPAEAKDIPLLLQIMNEK